MANFQQTIVVGHVGKDPELRTVGEKNTSVANFSVAVTTNKGKDHEHTEWFRIVAWGRTAEVCDQYVKKGNAIMVVGSLKTRKWQDDSGNDRYNTDLHASQVQLLGGKKEGGNKPAASSTPAAQPSFDEFDEDIPF